jgi:hypothetical protein
VYGLYGTLDIFFCSRCREDRRGNPVLKARGVEMALSGSVTRRAAAAAEAEAEMLHAAAAAEQQRSVGGALGVRGGRQALKAAPNDASTQPNTRSVLHKAMGVWERRGKLEKFKNLFLCTQCYTLLV